MSSQTQLKLEDISISEERTESPAASHRFSDELEAEVGITTFKPLEVNMLAAYVLLPLLTVLTCGVALLVVLKSDFYRSKVVYRETSIESATHFLIIENDETYELIDVHKNVISSIFYRKIKYEITS